MSHELSDILEHSRVTQLNMFNFCALMKQANHQSRTRGNTIASFRHSGVCPLDESCLFNLSLPRDESDMAEITQPD